jgi:UDP-glucose 4-epimerase
MNVLITGAGGFIGRNLKEGLSRELEVHAPSHGELELLDTASVERFFRSRSIDVVVHCATRPGHRKVRDTSDLVCCNTRMFLNLARNAGRFRKMVLLTSGAVYDQRHYLPGMKEEYFDAHVPEDGTGYSKYLCAKYAQALPRTVELRPFGVYGKYEDWQIRFISNLICKALHDLPLTMRQNRRFDYLYIDDLVRIVRHFILNDPVYKAYNVTPGSPVELAGLAAMVREESGRDLEIVVDRPGMGVEYSGDNTRLRREMKGLAFTGPREAIRELFRWYGEHRETIEKEKLLVEI